MGNAGIYWACLKLHLHFLSLFHDYVSSVIASASVSLRFSNKRREAFFLSNEHLLTLKEKQHQLVLCASSQGIVRRKNVD